MGLSKASDLFEVAASSLGDIAMLNNGAAGFVIPEYQRPYDWSGEHIERLYFDTLNGLKRFSETKKADESSSFTFLGTIILIKDNSKESDFTGESLEVVDGQQRLTTLAIFASAICESIRIERKKLDFNLIESNVSKWLKDEAEYRLLELYGFVVGSQLVRPNESFPFPRIIRKGDFRGRTPGTSEYKSPVGKLLYKFPDYFNGDDANWALPELGSSTAGHKLKDNFENIRNLISKINSIEFYEDTECNMLDIQDIKRSSCKGLLERLAILGEESEKNKALDYVLNDPELHNYVRLLTFAAYFYNYIILTRVSVEEESAAFDIFDALNTTGEPLTALETLKPIVVKHENESKPSLSYSGSESEESFRIISECLDERFPDTSRKQQETKEIVITFALYLLGDKLSKDLAAQRRFLRSNYQKAKVSGIKNARFYLESLSKIAKFRRYYWDYSGIRSLNKFHGNHILEEIQFFALFLLDMKTSLALPILARYWNMNRPSSGEGDFLEALKAVVAFLVLRRAATGSTATIDSDFRSVMEETKGGKPKLGLCAGLEQNNQVLPVGELKKGFIAFLLKKLGTLNQERWIDLVVENPLYDQSKPLTRFMLLASAHQSLSALNGTGTWIRESVRESHERIFLCKNRWRDPDYGTVEHIAPRTITLGEWNEDLDSEKLRSTLGNLVLLPGKENLIASNHSWNMKKLLYKAFTSSTEDELANVIELSKSSGHTLGDKTIRALNEGKRLPILEPLKDVEEWSARIVEKRSRNIAKLTWEIVRPWLDDT